jgi:hypothetical protein
MFTEIKFSMTMLRIQNTMNFDDADHNNNRHVSHVHIYKELFHHEHHT